MYIIFKQKVKFMRTLVDIPEQLITDLSLLCQDKGLSRAEIIHRAISDYLKQHKHKEINSFGLWKTENKHITEGLAYQKKLRDEW